jgi:hypothetical protein
LRRYEHAVRGDRETREINETREKER